MNVKPPVGDDVALAESWMVERYGPEMGALSSLNDVYAIRRHVRNAYASGLRDGRGGLPSGPLATEVANVSVRAAGLREALRRR